MQELIWIAVVGLTMTLSLLGALVRRDGGVRTRHKVGRDDGPVPGYLYYPGQAVDGPALGLPEAGVEAYCLERFGGGGRQRVILTVNLPPELGGDVDRIPGIVRAISDRLLELSAADVVVVELAEIPAGPSIRSDWVGIRSADGKGWSGTGEVGDFLLMRPTAL